MADDVTVRNQLPQWYEAYLRDISGKAVAQGNTPYQPYTGPRVAPTSTDTNAAYAQTRAGIGSYAPYMTQARNTVAGASNPSLDAGVFSSYMSPYTSGVVDRIAQLGQRNLSENLLPEVNSTFTGNGQYGSSRHADFTGRAVRDANESIMGAQAQALESGYNTALSGYGAGQDRAMQGGQVMAGLGEQQQSMGLRDAAALQAIGGAQEGKTQQSLDTAYGDFQTQKNYPWDQINKTTGVLYGQPLSQQQSTSGGSPDILSQLVGGLGAGIGAIGSTGGFGSGGWLGGLLGFKDGGTVRAGGSARRKKGPTRNDGSPRQNSPLAGIGGMGADRGSMRMAA